MKLGKRPVSENPVKSESHPLRHPSTRGVPSLESSDTAQLSIIYNRLRRIAAMTRSALALRLAVRTLILSVCLLAAPASAVAQEPVTLTTPNGMRFAAEWTSAGDNAPVAVFFPMCWATPPETWAPVAAALKTRGVSSLVTTYPGTPGNSGWPGPQPPPEPQTVYWNEQFRLVRETAFAFAGGKTNRRMVMAGASCGVERALDTAVDHADRVAGVVVFAGGHAPAHLEYVKSGHVPVLGVTSRFELDWMTQHDVLVKASANPASRLIPKDAEGHGTVLLKDRALAAEIAEWIAARLAGPR